MTALYVCVCDVMSGELYSETQKECSVYKQRNDELVRQLSSLMRRTLSPTEQSTLDHKQRETETETASAAGKHTSHDDDDDVERRQQSSSWLLDFSEEKQRQSGTDASLSSPSFVNINSSSTDDSSHQTQVSFNSSQAAL